MYGLRESDLEFISKTLHNFSEIDAVILYGSRAMGNYKSGSDIDLALKGKHLDSVVTALWGILNDGAPFPYDVDILDYDSITNNSLKEHIDRVGIIIYEKNRDRPPSGQFYQTEV